MNPIKKLSVLIFAPNMPCTPVANKILRMTCGIVTKASRTLRRATKLEKLHTLLSQCSLAHLFSFAFNFPKVSARKTVMIIMAPTNSGMSSATSFTTSASKL